mgnify:CR=1 FL=1
MSELTIFGELRRLFNERTERSRLTQVLKFNELAAYKSTGSGYVKEARHDSVDFQKDILAKISLKPADVVVDVACGDGTNADYLDHYFGVTTIRGEFSQAALDLQPDKKTRWIDASEHLPFDTGSVDFILVKDAVEHFRDQRNFLAESSRVLKPDGRLLIVSQSIQQTFFKVKSQFASTMFQINFDRWQDYAELVEQATTKQYPNYTHLPPYFKTSPAQLVDLALRFGLHEKNIDKLPPTWTSTPKTDWHDKQRFVLNLVKSSA